MALKYSITHNGNTWNSSTDVDTINLRNGSVTSSISSAGTRTLNCAGKYMPNNLVIGTKTLNCSDKIMSGNVVIAAQNSFDPAAHSRVGGRIFYIHSNSGNTYTFYAEDGTILTDISVGGLAYAYYYDKVGSNADMFYVYDDTRGPFTLVWDGNRERDLRATGATYTGIGGGKINTNIVLTKETVVSTRCIWNFVRNKRDNNYNGCNDWFIPTQAEQEQLKYSSLVNWFNYYNLWTSTERNDIYAYEWNWDFNMWMQNGKNNNSNAESAFIIRSF